MTDFTTSTQQMLPIPGSQIHFLVEGFSFASTTGFNSAGVVSRRGQTVTITQSLIDASKDRNGRSWIGLTADEQLSAYGRVIFTEGAAPDGLLPWAPNSDDWLIARQRARDEALGIADQTARAAAQQAVEARFGPINGKVR
jgi:hypothetical protein